jgi:hypothetical protein
VLSAYFQTRFYASSKNVTGKTGPKLTDMELENEVLIGRHGVASQMTECFRNGSQVDNNDGDD